MREFLRKSGLAAIIVASIISVAFLPKNVSQWVVLAIVGAWAITNAVLFCIGHKKFFRSQSFKRAVKSTRHDRKSSDSPLDFKYSKIQLGHRITDRLHSAYPNSTWDWKDMPTASLFTDGGSVRIATANTDAFKEAEVVVDNMWGKPHPDDLSRCENYGDFIEKLNYVIKKLYMALRNDGRLDILVGDIRTKGNFYSIQHNIMRMGRFESFVVKAQFNCVSDSRRYAKPFIPIVTESMLIYQKEDPYIISFSKRIGNTVDISKKDVDVLTWHHLVRSTIEKMGGEARLTDLYDVLHEHLKSKKNEHHKERIRATIYEHKEQYIQTGNGSYRLTYEVA